MGDPPLFNPIKEGIEPVPLAARPIDGVLFVQLNIFPVPPKLIAVVGDPAQTTWLATEVMVGNAFTVIKLLTAVVQPFTVTV